MANLCHSPMNAPELTEDEHLGLYQRATETGAEWWRVSVADRPENYRLEHGVDDSNGAGSVDIDLVVDAENLRAKLKKWHREGFVFDAPRRRSEAGQPDRRAFMPELQRVAARACGGEAEAACRERTACRNRAHRSCRRAVRRARPARAARQSGLSVLRAL